MHNIEIATLTIFKGFNDPLSVGHLSPAGTLIIPKLNLSLFIKNNVSLCFITRDFHVKKRDSHIFIYLTRT